MSGYILVHAEIHRVAEVAEHAREIEGVLHVDTVSGPFDLIVKAESTGPSDLIAHVEAAIKAIPGVMRTIPCPLASHERLWEEHLEPAYALA